MGVSAIGARTRVDAPVLVDCGSTLLLGVLRDASVSGAFLCTAAQLGVLSSVQVTLRTSRAAFDATITAHVVRRCADGYGLEWLDLAPAEIVALLEYADQLPVQRAIASRTAVSTSLSLNQLGYTGASEVAASSSSTRAGVSDTSTERKAQCDTDRQAEHENAHRTGALFAREQIADQ